ncbi:hypothetical protein FB567DRAFT_72314 [Paraphoma chrysanthemicola]|uniref:AA1-like domain-containing protein n=1 Tax=Paraphoma chrysanthemicola TaxID=798071 RepID=A0A8K0R6S8_9PLEO|nr:hypothetical protein FB567DRAFT_72314 [Paraphoma chrysanthemicola]
MKIAIVILLSALVAFSDAQFQFTPVHGCEWIKATTPVTNFTLFHGATNDSTPDSVRWQAPVLGLACSASESSATTIGSPATTTYVPCTSPGSSSTNARFLTFDDGASGNLSNATLYFVRYTQCAASIYAFYYESNFPLLCTSDAGARTCVSGGNATAIVTRELWLPPISSPPPPPRKI